MDQVKDFLKLAIKHRFWIAMVIASILPIVGYFVGSGPIKAKTTTETAAITAADTEVQKYASGVVPNASYKTIVTEKTDELTKDVDASWKKLYSRQAPLLTWPDRVSEQFTKWGRNWPEGVDASQIQFVVIDYINAYPQYVTEVYKSFNPFDPEEGTGVVSAPPEAALLRPSTFTIDAPPSLGKIWMAQEKLWIQRTLLDVIATVNKEAKDWDGATIKQINMLEVGSVLAQDQRSIAQGETLEDAPDVVDPNAPVDEVEEPVAAMGGRGGKDGDMGGMAGMMGGMGGMGGQAAASTKLQYITSESTQYKRMPVMMKVLIEQEKIQDYLVALANSPMNIDVKDFEMAKPQTRVIKPEKGLMMAGGFGGMMGGGDEMGGGKGGMMAGMAGMPGMMGGMGGMRGAGRGGMSGYGGNASRGMGSMMSQMMGGGRGAGMEGMMGGMMGGMGGMNTPAKKGVDKRSENRAKKAELEIESIKNGTRNSLRDPYYNIVEVTIYGQVRFFNPPPAEEPAEPSQAEEGDGDTAKAEGDGEAKKDAPAAEGAMKAEEDEAEAKPEADADPKPEAEAAPKADEAKPAGDAPPKADEADEDEPADKPKDKAETKETPKDEAAKAETPKAEGNDASGPK